MHIGVVKLTAKPEASSPPAALFCLSRQAGFVDEIKRRMPFSPARREEIYENPRSRFILHAYSLRFAINNGFKRYDFLRGNEPYKYLFGCKDRQIWHIIITVKTASASTEDAQEPPAQAARDRQPA